MLTFPQAKINIGLFVVGKRSDGYHNLETIFYPIPLQDTLEIKELKDSDSKYLFQLVGRDCGGNPHDNIVVRVFKELQEEYKLPPMDIYLDKHIPIGAGLGGGSSDAAEIMLQLNEYFNLRLTSEEMEKRLSKFGADCPFFVRKQTVYAEGIGDIFSPVKLSLKGWHLVLIKPNVSVSTKEAYSGIVPKPSEFALQKIVQTPVEQWANFVINDFEESVFKSHPEIAAIKQTLYDMGATYASMSGSGSAVYGLFKNSVESLEAVFGDCFVFQTKLLK